MQEKKMHRSTTNKMVAGICGGLADYFGLDASLMRIIFVVLALLGGPGILLYIVLWIVLPEGPDTAAMGGGGGGAGGMS
jgi:phage shock protein C